MNKGGQNEAWLVLGEVVGVHIHEARAEYAEGREMPFDQAAVERITTIGRQLLTKRDRNQ